MEVLGGVRVWGCRKNLSWLCLKSVIGPRSIDKGSLSLRSLEYLQISATISSQMVGRKRYGGVWGAARPDYDMGTLSWLNNKTSLMGLVREHNRTRKEGISQRSTLDPKNISKLSKVLGCARVLGCRV